MGLLLVGESGVGFSDLVDTYPDCAAYIQSTDFEGATYTACDLYAYVDTVMRFLLDFSVVCVDHNPLVLSELKSRGIEYLHILRHDSDRTTNDTTPYDNETFKRITSDAYVVLKEGSKVQDFLLAASGLLTPRSNALFPLILSGIAGVGKTTLEKTYPTRVRDFESTCWKWIGGGSEEHKGVLGLERNSAYPGNMMLDILDSLRTFDILCLSYHQEIRDALALHGLSCVYVFPCYGDTEEYASRYHNRGNTDYFVGRVIGNWDIVLSLQPSLDNHLIVLQAGGTLEGMLRRLRVL